MGCGLVLRPSLCNVPRQKGCGLYQSKTRKRRSAKQQTYTQWRRTEGNAPLEAGAADAAGSCCPAALLAVGYFVWNRVTEVQPDYTVAVVSRTDPDTAFLSQLETQLEALARDVNGDGKVKVTVKGIWLALDFETQDAALQRLMQSSEDKLNSDFYLCESTLFIVDDPTAMEQRYGCFQTLDGTDPEEEDVLSVADFALPLQDTSLANVQNESSTLWYAARRLNEGMDADAAAALNALWERLM